jgi:hypothetical protein
MAKTPSGTAPRGGRGDRVPPPPHQPGHGTNIEQFLNPQSMLTPGLAGGMVATITLTVGSALGLSPILSVIVLSFVVGLLVIAVTTGLWLKLVYYILNSLIISSVALGAVLGARGGTVNSSAQPPSTAAFSNSNQPPGVSVVTTAVPNSAISPQPHNP